MIRYFQHLPQSRGTRPGTRPVSGWMDFIGPLFNTGLQIGGTLATRAIIGNSGGSAPQVVTLPTVQPNPTGAQWVPGVSNAMVLGGGAALLVALIVFTSRRS